MPKQSENNHAEIKFIIKRGDEVEALCPFHMETVVQANSGQWIPEADEVSIVEVVSTQKENWDDITCNSCVSEDAEHKHMTVGDLIKQLTARVCDYDLDAPVVISHPLVSDEPVWYALKIVDFKPHDRTHLMFTIDGDEPVME